MATIFFKMVTMNFRLFVLTDICSLETGVRQTDDAQSLIRLLLYSNQLEIEGLAATSDLIHGQLCRPGLIRRIVDAYEHDWPNLRLRDPKFPRASLLRERIVAGTPFSSPTTDVWNSIGFGKDTGASELLIQATDREDDRPLWVTVWGGTADLAQALWKVRSSRPAEQVRKFVAKMRVHACYDQDSTAQWVKCEFPELLYITRTHGIRGMYRGGDAGLSNREWVEKHVHTRGALGRLYPIYEGNDLWSDQLGGISGVKECDTPTYLNLISGNPLCGWGGTFVEVEPFRYEDDRAEDAKATDPDKRLAGVYRHRAAYQADFGRRLTWCN